MPRFMPTERQAVCSAFGRLAITGPTSQAAANNSAVLPRITARYSSSVVAVFFAAASCITSPSAMVAAADDRMSSARSEPTSTIMRNAWPSRTLGFRPHAGDVMVIDDLRVVHAVLGSVLEEFATTSNDAVLRLHDQNKGEVVRLPAEHPDLRAILSPLTTTPRGRVTLGADGWRREPIAETSDVAPIVDMPDRGLRGFHLVLDEGHEHHLDAAPECAVTLVGLAGKTTIEVAGIEISLEPGDSVPIAPTFAATVHATRGAAASRCRWCAWISPSRICAPPSPEAVLVTLQWRGV